jgi:hypothetical protein
MLILRGLFQCLALKAAFGSVIHPRWSNISAVGLMSNAIKPANISLDSSNRYISKDYDDTPSPTQPGIISTCTAYYLVKQGDYCDTVISQFGNLTLSEFYTWNP